jgi:hypothetical protein
MFASALNWALAIIFIFSLGYFILSLDRTYKKKSNVLAVALIVLNFIVYVFFTGDYIDTGFALFSQGGIAFLAGVLLVISLIITNLKSSTERNGFAKILVCILIAIPLLVLLVPFGYETYLLNKCSYLLTYNYQNGIIQSDYTCIAIVDGKPVTVTLQKNILGRQSTSFTSDYRDFVHYDIVFESENITFEDPEEAPQDADKILVVARDAKLRQSAARSAFADYFPEGDYTMITLCDQEDGGTLLAEYFYSGGEFVDEVHTVGGLSSIAYYE